MMKHLQLQLSPTPSNKSFLITYIDTNTTLLFEAQYMTSVGRKLWVYVLFEMTDLCWLKPLNPECCQIFKDIRTN